MKTNVRLTTLDHVQLVDLFGAVVDCNDLIPRDYLKLNTEAMKRGYIVEANACNHVVEAFIESKACNVNSTFYKTFEDVTSKTRFELFIDQVFHYMTTYGTDFSLGNGYVPNADTIDVSYISALRDYKVITLVSAADMYEKCMNMLGSGIALKNATLTVLCRYVCNYFTENRTSFNNKFEIDRVLNREAIVMICDLLNIAPNRKFDLMRYIMLKTTGNAMIIKNRDAIRSIIRSGNQFNFNTLSEYQLRELASIFYRFKPIFLAFKKVSTCSWTNAYQKSNNVKVINKIRRMAKKYHTPMVIPAENTIMSKAYTRDELMQMAAEMNAFQLVRICNTCIERLNHTDESNIYLVRNGRMFIKTDAVDYTGMKKYYIQVFDVMYDELRCRLSDHACYFKANKNLKLTVPTSEKNFVGDIPFGSYIEMADHAMIGIYWRNEWGTRDFDLSMIDVTGRKIGWNSSYYNQDSSVVYSGDMTNANPEATEILYYRKNAPKGFININRFNGNDGSKYKIFVANEEKSVLPHNYMVDPANIKFDAMCVSDTTQQIIGLVDGERFTIMNVGNGYQNVSRKTSNEESNFKALTLKSRSYIQMYDLLRDAGFIDIDTVEETDDWKIPADAKIIDLTTLNRDTLINILSGNI